MSSSNFFSTGERVLISDSYNWAKNAHGTVTNPQTNEWLEGYEDSCSRDVKTLQSTIKCYWIRFDEPQIDPDGDGPYSEAEIESKFLVRLTNG